MKNTIITPEQINAAEQISACCEALKWLREQPRTVGELCAQNPEWAAWAACYGVDITADQRDEWLVTLSRGEQP
jgi:hypothetical protein